MSSENIILGDTFYQNGEEGVIINVENGNFVRLEYEGEKAIMPEFPKTVVLKVTEAPPGIRGDSVSNSLKTVVCETGLKINVPLFVNEGAMVKINTDTGEYLGRAQENDK